MCVSSASYIITMWIVAYCGICPHVLEYWDQSSRKKKSIYVKHVGKKHFQLFRLLLKKKKKSIFWKK